MSRDLSPDEMLSQAADIRAKVFALRIKELAVVYGSIRAVGRALNIDHVYLHRLMKGERQNPSKQVLRKLGL